MPAVCLIRRPDDDTDPGRGDAAFAEKEVLPPLPALGFDRVFRLPDASSPLSVLDQSVAVIVQSVAVIVVLSTEAAREAEFLAAAEAALRSHTPVIVVHRSAPEVAV